MDDRVVVPFEGEGAGIGPLTWGQQQVWAAMVEIGSALAMGGVVAVTDGRTVEDFAAELEFLMSRYPEMRTRLRVAAGGAVTQEVFGSGEAVLHVSEVHDGDPAAAAEWLATQWRDLEWDYAGEWPLRMGVVVHKGAVTHVVALMHHAAADLGGVSAMMRALEQRSTGASPGPHALDLARMQAEPGAARHTAASMRYWEEQLRAIPATRFTDRGEWGEPRYLRLVWTSPALHLATEAVATQAGADQAWVLLAAFAVALGRVTGVHPFVAQAIIGNRFRPGLRDAVSPLTQNGLCVLDVEGTSAQEAIARARTASMRTSKYAYYEPAARLALIDRVERERGERIDLACLYNDRRTVGPAGHPATAEHIRAALGETRVLREVPMRFFNERLMVNIDDVPGTVQVTAEVDTRFLPPAQLRALLAELEAFVVDTALAEGDATT
ncbi:MAG: hypothetical protein JWM93_2959 [Frankiales bacterium]|nr:hypothetical protein [Frankiales bacterium]